MNPRDYLEIDRLLTDEERLIKETVSRYVNEKYLPGVAEHFENGTFDTAVPKALGDLNVLGMHLKGYGCAGTSAVAYGVACLELEAGDSALRSFCSVQGSLAMFAIWKWGSEEQKQRWLPGMAAGDLIGCFGLTEPDSGSDPGSMRTTAKKDGEDWILNGSKMWITSGSIADVAVVWAKTDDGVQGFLVEPGMKGFTAPEMHHKLSLRASVTSELAFDDVRIPDANRLPEVQSLKGPLSCLNEARYGIVWGVVGAARSCFEAALDYAMTRKQFDEPIASFQLTQAKLADMATKVQQGYLLALRLGQLKDEGRIEPEHISMGKRANARMALDVARTARGILGANGITLEYPVLRHANNLESVFTYEGTDEIHTLSIGMALTGIPAFR
ncbi:MAG TPA: acyl-CoA dehydrogenase family protein [Solirubrobacterales bacterium]|nr:acyl-CoA dehydrogenase family protein [Solirubrobacterales bacterium]HMX72204.1 acyl-CoA dehydrogenase family protein [Solirubrobacterales bacterium]HMY25814.1 acyl-CoA dehydrogenase family protein [Solirubrobacterales bacterium]HNA24838.1 acyl-CoA dehydrogenase family protein [Solirubrobacterales bacterium]HNA44673.1 acyl-CoA dehydrogenase family protein [Solirubrobacterales bacterium]